MNMAVLNSALSTTFGEGGQIVRIYLENFMSSDCIEVRPGLHLNMIIGPNGSGKSTLLSGVLLGLGGKLKTLNRNSYSEFVKCGCDQSIIEIELRNTKGRNHIIRRVITNQNKNQFFLNGKIANKNEIESIRDQYNIQVDNLCCFLSQERVQDFSRMDPQQLLENTEVTIGDGHLSNQHNKLKEMRVGLLSFQNIAQKTKNELENEKRIIERLHPKIVQYREKMALNEQKNMMDQKLHYLQYQKAHMDVKEVEKDLKAAEENEEKKSKDVKNAEKKLADIEKNSKAQREELESKKLLEVGKRQTLQSRLASFRRKVDEITELDGSLQTEMRDEEEKKTALRQYQTQVDKLTNDVQALGATGNDAALKQEQHKLSRELTNCREKETLLLDKKVESEEELRSAKQELSNAKRLLEGVNGVKSRREQQLRREHPNTYDGVVWLRQNRHLFRGHVFEPMILELDIPDSNKAAIAEIVINRRDLIAFTVTIKDDLKILVQELRKNRKLNVNIVSSEDVAHKVFAPPIPINSLKGLGFSNYLKDCIKGPEEIIQYLCQSYRLHMIPVGDNRVNDNASKVPDVFTRFFSGDKQYLVKSSRYGNNLKSTTVRALPKHPNHFTEFVDHSKLEQTKKRASDLGHITTQLAEKTQELCEQLEQVAACMAELRKKKSELATRDEERKSVHARLQRAISQVTHCKASLRDPVVIRNEFLMKKQEKEKSLLEQLDNLHKSHVALEAAHREHLQAAIRFKASRIGFDQLQDDIRLCKEALFQAKETSKMVETKYRSAEAARSRLRHALEQLTGFELRDRPRLEELRAKFQSLPDSVDDLEQGIQDAIKKADFIDIDESGRELLEYTTREKNAKILEEKVEELAKVEQTHLTSIAEKRNEWLEPVRQLIARVNEIFSQHFASLKYAGEVALAEPEDENDFEAYGVKILVKYWDDMPLQELSRYKHSGGERTVATAIYGLSLQNLTSVPFRFVDEINQGMDARNESSICEMLSIACAKADSPQYFYLTPKLMDTFKCPKNMAVLCVHNGPRAICTTEWDVDAFCGGSQQKDFDGDYEYDD